jgi:outer membrane protein insertion porin family/translocation and assembly module TamA
MASPSMAKDEGLIVVNKLSLQGVSAVDQSRLKAVLATRTGSRLPWGQKRFFDRAKFELDLKRIEAFYADRGYPDARVTGFDVQLNNKQDAVEITITVSEGQPVTLSRSDFVGFEVIPAARLDALERRTVRMTGRPLDRELLAATQSRALNELREHGYPYAKVATKEDEGPNKKEAAVSFVAEPGTIAYFGPVTISGNRGVSDHVISREVQYKPGDLYQRSKLQNTQRDLYRMELFQFANVEPLNQELQPSEVATRITVAEGARHRFNFGLGYGTEERGRVDADYRHLNFLGGARTAGAHVRWSSLERGIRLNFIQPYFLGPRFSLEGEGQQWRTVTPAYVSTVSGAKISLTHRRSANTAWSVSMSSEHDISTIAEEVRNDPSLRTSLIALGLDPSTAEQNGTLSLLGFDMHPSRVDNLLDARRGYQLAFHVEQAGDLLPGTFHFRAASIDGRYYQPLSTRRLVLATRVQLGSIDPIGGSTVPLPRRYFLGGSSGVRGWSRYEISPLSESGVPIGGNSLFALSTELRARIRRNLGAVAFLDSGNVWADTWGINLRDLRYAIGAGLRYRTPVGPMRFDFGYQLNPIPGLLVDGEPQSRRWRMHFSIGQAF